MPEETLQQRLPAALQRIGWLLGSDAIQKLPINFRHDLMAVHAAATDWQQKYSKTAENEQPTRRPDMAS